MKKLCGLAAVLLLAAALSLNAVAADKMVIPVDHYWIYEPSQKAIIAWNGETEVLILSVDLRAGKTYHVEESWGNGEEEAAEVVAVEVLPLPSVPEVEQVSTKAFTVIQQYVNERLREKRLAVPFYEGLAAGAKGAGSLGLEVVFTEIIGPHNVTVLKAENASALLEWLQQVAVQHGYELIEAPIIDDAEQLLQGYIERGYSYFAVDVVTVEDSIRSVKPLAYTFKSEKLYFPLKISTLQVGWTTVTLFTITTGRVNLEDLRIAGFEVKMEDHIPRDVVEKASPKLAELFDGDELWITAAVYRGDLADLSYDVEARLSGSPVHEILIYFTPSALCLAVVAAVFAAAGFRGRERLEKSGWLYASIALLALIGVVKVAASAVVVATAFPISPPYIYPGDLTTGEAMFTGVLLGTGILALVSALLLAWRRPQGVFAGGLAAIIAVAGFIVLASISFLKAPMHTFSSVRLLLLGVDALMLLPSIVVLVFIGLSWRKRESVEG
ncbi:MAG: DUF2330 domain-containing protein [Candidatus Verstraetearchaeota archaeon]|nr:DUF2330 domain-containing protein [Candidatus Verstraetearchaeota archaeon]